MDAVEFLRELKRRSKSDPDYYGEDLGIPKEGALKFLAQQADEALGAVRVIRVERIGDGRRWEQADLFGSGAHD